MEMETQLIDIAEFIKDGNKVLAKKRINDIDAPLHFHTIHYSKENHCYLICHIESNIYVTNTNCAFVYKRSYLKDRMVPIGIMNIEDNQMVFFYFGNTEEKMIPFQKPNVVPITPYYKDFYIYKGDRRAINYSTHYVFSEDEYRTITLDTIHSSQEVDCDDTDSKLSLLDNGMSIIAVHKKFYNKILHDLVIELPNIEECLVTGYVLGREDDSSDCVAVLYDQFLDSSPKQNIDLLEKMWSK